MPKKSIWKKHDSVLKALRELGVSTLTINQRPSEARRKLGKRYAKSRLDSFFKFVIGKSLASLQTRSYVLGVTQPGSVWSQDPRRDKALKILRSKGMTPRWIRRQPGKVIKLLVESKFEQELAEELASFYVSLTPKQLSGRCGHLGKSTKPARWTKLRQKMLRILKKAGINPKQMITKRALVLTALAESKIAEKTATLFADFLAIRSNASVTAACFKYRALTDAPGWDQQKISALGALRKKGIGCPAIAGHASEVEQVLLELEYQAGEAESLAEFLSAKTTGALYTQCRDHGFADKKRSARIKKGIKEMQTTDQQYEEMLTFVRARLGTLDYHDIAKEWNKAHKSQGYPKLDYERVHRFVKSKLKSQRPGRSATNKMPSTQRRRKRLAKKKQAAS